MSTVTGKLIGLPITTTPDPAYSVDITLCGYGSRSPVAHGAGSEAGSFCSVELEGVVPTQPGNAIEVELVGNDLIEPAGTYYTFAFKDANGDILQINAYIFLDADDYDLTNTQPFDPTLPPPPLPPLIYSQLLIVPFSPTPVFPGDQFTTLAITLTGDVTSSSLTGFVIGNLYTFIITQGAAGGWKFKWPIGVLNPAPVNSAPAGITIQTFVTLGNNGPLLPVGGATYYP